MTDATVSPPAEPAPLVMRLTASAMAADRVARGLLLVAALSVFLVLGFILYTLLGNSLEFFQTVSWRDFFFGTEFRQAGTVELSEDADAGRFGVLPFVVGTLVVTIGAVLIGLPIGLGTAIYLAEYASPRLRSIVKPALELLAGIPSIVFGFFALYVISPLLRGWTAPGTTGSAVLCAGDSTFSFSALSALIVVGIMVLPIITSLSEDALRAVPRHLKEASLGLGATRWETTKRIVVPAALSGIVASFVLGVSRAIGESMAVAMAAGTQPVLSWNPCHAMQTMTGLIVQRASGDLPQIGPSYTVLFAVGLTLFAMTLTLNVLAGRFVRRYREKDGGDL